MKISESIIIKKAEEKDIDGVISLLKDTWEDGGTPAHNLPHILNRKIIEKDHLFFLAKEEERPIGMISAVDKNIFFEIDSIYIDKNFQRRGVGTHLLKHIKELSGERKLIVKVNSKNNKGINFYNKFGFKRINEKEVILGDKKIGIYAMEL